jgi:predicted RNA-binding Zn-ribbon protein involved in translation (DUF1610 family)
MDGLFVILTILFFIGLIVTADNWAEKQIKKSRETKRKTAANNKKGEVAEGEIFFIPTFSKKLRKKQNKTKISQIPTETEPQLQTISEIAPVPIQSPEKYLSDPTQDEEKDEDENETKYYCPECGAWVTRVPISNYADATGRGWHIPYYGRAQCTNCGWRSEPFGRGLKKLDSEREEDRTL